jgi:hypothetical protein
LIGFIFNFYSKTQIKNKGFIFLLCLGLALGRDGFQGFFCISFIFILSSLIGKPTAGLSSGPLGSELLSVLNLNAGLISIFSQLIRIFQLKLGVCDY